MFFLVGLFAAGAGAWVGAADTVAAQKFCEPCNLYMEEKALLGISVHTAQRAFTCLQEGRFNEAALDFNASSGVDFEPTLHRCPQCGGGYLEATYCVRTNYFDRGKPKDDEANWRALSAALTPEALLPFTRTPTRTE